MRAFKFFKIDCIRCKSQLLLGAVLMAVISFIFMFKMKSVEFGVGYLFFICIMYAGQPFNVETQSESGFIDMIPGTRSERIVGRFLYGIACIMLGLVLGALVITVFRMRGNTISRELWPECIAVVGMGLVLMAIQYICFYAAGKGRSQQFMALIQIVPSMAFFLFVYKLSELVVSQNGGALKWIMDSMYPLSLGILLFGLVGFAFSFYICNKIMDKRDYA